MEDIPMKIIQLEYFCAVARYHSISEAARKLYVTQPAISNAIKELEKEYAIRLFFHGKNKLSLTSEGEQFYRTAEALLKQVENASVQLHALGKSVPPLRIGIPPLLSTVFFPDLLVDFKKRYPTISVELFEYGSKRAAYLTSEGFLDLSIVNMHFYDVDKFHACPMLSDELVYCIATDHPLAGSDPLPISALADEHLILCNTDSVLDTTLSSLFEASAVRPEILLHSSQLATVHTFIVNHLGGAFLYHSVAQKYDDLAEISITPPIDQNIGLIWPKGKYLNSSVEKFISFVKERG